MSEPMIAISKELRDRLLATFPINVQEIATELRDAPQTVSLEGVEKRLVKRMTEGFSENFGDVGLMECMENSAKLIVSDLRRLVVPVQPSAVVSREDVRRRLASQHGWLTSRQIAEIADSMTALQLPQPVAPVQSGGVDEQMWEKTISERDAAEELIEQVAIYFGCTEEWSSVHSHFDCVREAIVAHLTTTQSAPSVGSVPTVEEIKEVWFNAGAARANQFQALHKFITSRLEAKQ